MLLKKSIFLVIGLFLNLCLSTAHSTDLDETIFKNVAWKKIDSDQDKDAVFAAISNSVSNYFNKINGYECVIHYTIDTNKSGAWSLQSIEKGDCFYYKFDQYINKALDWEMIATFDGKHYQNYDSKLGMLSITKAVSDLDLVNDMTVLSPYDFICERTSNNYHQLPKLKDYKARSTNGKWQSHLSALYVGEIDHHKFYKLALKKVFDRMVVDKTETDVVLDAEKGFYPIWTGVFYKGKLMETIRVKPDSIQDGPGNFFTYPRQVNESFYQSKEQMGNRAEKPFATCHYETMDCKFNPLKNPDFEIDQTMAKRTFLNGYEILSTPVK